MCGRKVLPNRGAAEPSARLFLISLGRILGSEKRGGGLVIKEKES